MLNDVRLVTFITIALSNLDIANNQLSLVSFCTLHARGTISMASINTMDLVKVILDSYSVLPLFILTLVPHACQTETFMFT